MRDTDYITIQGWMMNRLGLSGVELLCYATIFAFSHADGHDFHGSQQYLANWCGVSRITINKVVNNLIDKGYIKCEAEEISGRNTVYHYTALTDGLNETMFTTGVNKINNDCKQNLHNNNIDNNIEIITSVDVPQSGGKAEKAKEKKYTVTHRCRLIFEQEYLQKTGIEYYYTPKDAAAVKQLIGKIRKYLPGDEKENEEVIVQNFSIFIHMICTSGKVEKWIVDNLSLSNINSKFNEIYSQLKNGRQQHQNARDDEQSFFDELERRYGNGSAQ